MRVLLLCLALLAAPAGAVELTLALVTARVGTADVQLRLDSRASFDFDPDTRILRSSGTWIAEHSLPNRQARFSHMVEDLSVDADGRLAVKSYECVEGTFGAPFLAANLCGNYRFGPNGLDDGGVADDVVVAPPRSLAVYRLSSLEWNGDALVLTLSTDGGADADIFGEQGLTLSFHSRRQ